MTSIRVQLLTPSAVLPRRATPGSAGYDLSVGEDHAITLQPGETRSVRTGLAIEVDQNICYLVCSRSGLAFNKNLIVYNAPGVIDSDYRGEIRVLMHNGSPEKVTILPGDRIAQIVFLNPILAPVVELEELAESVRGSGGFGSTGN